MRTTLNIDDDVLLAIREMARHERMTVGEVISALARRALLQASAGSASSEPESFCGFRPFASRGGVVSNELVNWLRESDSR
jgi:hypothetical protein